ncbi:flagellar hook-length control protein FliK [Pantoea sp.]|uniref:flagellar hook-length control protein FliK n=1 Tax=Pantoea sp. TaxID=69393 RepID=UPI0031DE0F51
MIPLLSSLLLPGSNVLPAPSATPEMANLPQPMVPAFMLGSTSPPPQSAPSLIEDTELTENNDPEQLMQLLLDPTLAMTNTLPLQVTQRDIPQMPVSPSFNEKAALIPQETPEAQEAPEALSTQAMQAPGKALSFHALLRATSSNFNAMQTDGLSVQASPQRISTTPLMQAVPSTQVTPPISLQVNQPITSLQAAQPQFSAPLEQLAAEFLAAPMTMTGSAPLPSPREQMAAERPLTLPQRLQSSMLPGQVMPADGPAPVQPVKLRTPKDVSEASQQVVALMQAHPDKPLAKVLPAQIIMQTQQLLHISHSVAPSAAAAAPPLKLPEAMQEKANVLREALGEHLQTQIDLRSQKATIRLDPPNLGKLDISLHYEGGKLQVQIQAAQPEIYRALQQVSQELRSALVEQNQVAVNVQISQQQGEQRHAPHQQHTQEAVLSNLALNEVTEEQRHRDLSILTTV